MGVGEAGEPVKELNPQEFRVWLHNQRKAKLQSQAEARAEAGAPEPPSWAKWFHTVPQCPDRAPDGRKCRLKADHPSHITNQHAGWRRVGKVKAWAVWEGGPLTRNHYGVSRQWRKANKSGQVRFA